MNKIKEQIYEKLLQLQIFAKNFFVKRLIKSVRLTEHEVC